MSKQIKAFAVLQSSLDVLGRGSWEPAACVAAELGKPVSALAADDAASVYSRWRRGSGLIRFEVALRPTG